MTLRFLFKSRAATAPAQTSTFSQRSRSSIKQLVLLGSLFGLTACHHESVKPTCYDCELIAASGSNGTITRQTSTFCTEAEKNQFLEAHKNDPSMQYLACKNQ